MVISSYTQFSGHLMPGYGGVEPSSQQTTRVQFQWVDMKIIFYVELEMLELSLKKICNIFIISYVHFPLKFETIVLYV